MEFFPEHFAAMLHVSINYNIPAAVTEVVEAASDAFAAVTNSPHAELDQIACALEIARQVRTIWCHHAGTNASDLSRMPWLAFT